MSSFDDEGARDTTRSTQTETNAEQIASGPIDDAVPVEATLVTQPDQVADNASSGVVKAAELNPNPNSNQKHQLPQPHLGFAVLWSVGLLLVQLVVAIIFVIGFMLVLVASGGSLTELNKLNDRMLLVLIPVGTGTTVVVAVAICLLLFGRRLGRRIGWRALSPLQLGLVVLCVLPLAVLTSEVTNWASYYLPTFQMEEMMAFGRAFWPLVFVAGCLFPGLGEEIFFRGFLGRGLLARHGVVLGVLFTSLLFGLVHIEPIQATGAFALGIAMHYVFLTTRSLLAPIVLHTLNNALAFASFRWNDVFPVPGVSAAAEQGVLHTPPLLLGAAVLALAPLLLVLFHCRTRWVLADGQEWSPGYVTGESPNHELGAVAVPGKASLGMLFVVLLTSAVLIACLIKAHQDYLGTS